MILLDSKPNAGSETSSEVNQEFNVPEATEEPKKKVKSDESKKTEQAGTDDIPF